jgi:transcription initiation factor TFIID subunit 2
VPSEEEKTFLDMALEQIERVLRRDEWSHSYQNIWTIAGLEAKRRLMKADVIPKSYVDFGQYLLDGTRDLIRIKAFESLIDIGYMMDPNIFTFFIYCLTTDPSPYVRNKLIDAAAFGLAAIAFGEHTKAVKSEPTQDEGDPLLLVQDSAHEIEARKERFARKENLDAALKALRREMEETYGSDERHYSTAMRRALDHPGLGRVELESMLDVAAMMFEEANDWVVSVGLPKAWKVERPAQQLANRVSNRNETGQISEANQVQLTVVFQSYYKTKPKQPLVPPIPVPAPPAAPAPAPSPAPMPVVEQKRPIPIARTSSIKINTHKASTPKPPAPPPSSDMDTIVASSSISRQPSTSSTPVPKPSRPLEASSIPSAKRPRPDKEERHPSPAPKRPKVEKPSGLDGIVERKKRRIVTLKTKNPKRLALILNVKPSLNGRTSLPSGPARDSSSVKDSITAKPARKPLPSGDQPTRKPLPGSSFSSPHSQKPSHKISLSTHNTPAPKPKVASPAATPTPSTPASAPSSRPKIKIIRKPHKPPGP